MQWTYDIHGMTPDYRPPRIGAATENRNLDVRGQSASDAKKNFVRRNLKLNNTGVSSPLKGAPLVHRTIK